MFSRKIASVIMLIFISLAMMTMVSASCVSNTDCGADIGLWKKGDKYIAHCDVETNTCVCKSVYTYEENGKNSHEVPDEERTCHHRGGDGERGFLTFIVVFCITCCSIELAIALVGMYGLRLQGKLKVNVQTSGFVGVAFFCVGVIWYMAFDPYSLRGGYGLTHRGELPVVFFFWIPDIGILASFNLFFLYWRDLTSDGLNQVNAKRFIQGSAANKTIAVSVFVLVILIFISGLIGTSQYYMFFYSLYSLVFVCNFIYMGIKLNKRMQATSLNNDKARKRLNKIAATCVGTNILVLIHALQVALTVSFVDEWLYMFDIFFAKLIAINFGGILIYSFWPTKALAKRKTEIMQTRYTTTTKSKGTSLDNAPRTPKSPKDHKSNEQSSFNKSRTNHVSSVGTTKVESMVTDIGSFIALPGSIPEDQWDREHDNLQELVVQPVAVLEEAVSQARLSVSTANRGRRRSSLLGAVAEDSAGWDENDEAKNKALAEAAGQSLEASHAKLLRDREKAEFIPADVAAKQKTNKSNDGNLAEIAEDHATMLVMKQI